MIDNDSRAQFEAWRKSLIARPNLMRDGEYYEDYDTQIAWSGWRASIAASQPVGVEPVAEVNQRNDGGCTMRLHDGTNWPVGKTQLYAAPPAPAAVPVDGNLLRQLRDSIHGDCFMGEDWEKEAVDKLLATHPQPAAEPQS